MIDRVRSRKENHRQRGRIYRIGFAVVGSLLILVGIVLTAPGVPGPGLLVVALGLAMLALEFDWAERLLERILDKIEAATDTSRERKILLAVAGAVAGVAALAAVLLWDVPVLPV